MANSNEISTRVSVDYDDAGIKRAVADEERLGRSVGRTGEAAEEAARGHQRRGRGIDAVDRKLRELALEEERYQRRLSRGDEVTDEARRSAERRIRTIDRLGRRLEVHRAASDRATQAVRRHTTAEKESVAAGPSMVAGLAASAAGYLSVASAAGVAMQALRDYRQEQDEAGRAMREARRGVSSLAQISDTPEEFKALVDKARALVESGGARTLDEGARIVFALDSAGQSDSLELFGQLAAKGILPETEALANAVGALTTAMGKDETGSARDIISKAFGASEVSPGTVTGVLTGAARAGVQAGMLGVSDEELLAGTAVISKATNSTDIAGTYLRSLFQSLLQKGGFKNQPLMQSLAQVEAMGLSDEDLIKFAASGFRVGD